MPPTPKTSQVNALQAEFAPEEHKTRSGGQGRELTYIDIANTIKRVNSVLGVAGWTVNPLSKTTVNPIRRVTDGEESITYMAFTELWIDTKIDGLETTLYGVGGMTNPDPDMAVKTALAEAFKKAWHSVGVALYLWDGDALRRVEASAALAKKTPTALKREVWAIAKKKLNEDKPTLAQVGALFGVKPGDLTEPATLIGILTAEAA